MRRTLFISVALAIVIGGIALVAGLGGYYSHKNRIEPVFSLTERVEVRLRRDLGIKTDTELAMERIETIFLTLKGRVHVMPDRNFLNGGGMTLWGDDLIILHQSGKTFWLDRDQEEGMQLSGLRAPENGVAAYITLAAEKYPDGWPRVDAIRYNDIEFIDTPDHRGMVISYTYIDTINECYRSRLSWLPIGDDVTSIRDLDVQPEDWELLFETSPCLAFNPTRELIVAYMAGGRVAFKAPHTIYMGSGEYHLDGIYRPDAGIQSDDSDYGKTLAIDLRNGEHRIMSRGHRNLQGVALDAEGRLWTTEHGMRGGDELNLIREGENYGWPLEDMGTLYNGVPQESPNGPGRHLSFAAPVYAWLPSAAVSSLALVEGFHPAWDGDLLIGSLRERTLFRARIHGERLLSLEPIPIGQRIRDVTQWGPDRIALWLDLNEVVVLEIEPKVDPLEGLADRLVEGGMEPVLAASAAQTLESCAECHAYVADIHGAGPSLAGVVGRRVAGTAFGGYSGALRGAGGSWDVDRLAAYLQDPGAAVDGTAMTGLGLGDAALSAAVATALGTISDGLSDTE